MITLNNCKDTSPVVMKVCRKVNTNAIIKQRRYTCVRAQIYFKPLGKLQSIQPTCSIRSIINQLSHSDEWYTVMSLPIVFKNNSVKITWDEASACTHYAALFSGHLVINQPLNVAQDSQKTSQEYNMYFPYMVVDIDLHLWKLDMK